jgi:hypothetical protein
VRPARLLTASGAAALIAATPAHAIDWRGSLGFSQAFATGGGIDTGDEPDTEVTSSTSLSFDFVGETPRARLTFSPGVSLFFSTDDDFSASEAIQPNFRGSIATFGSRTRLSSSLSLTPRFVPRNQAVEGVFDDPFDDEEPPPDIGLDDDENTRRRGDATVLQIDANFNTSVNHAIDTRNSLTGGFFVRRREFSDNADDDDLEPSTSFGVNGSWSRQLTPLTSGSLSATARQFLPDEGDEDNTRTYSLSAGLSTRFSPRLSASGSLGLSVTEADSEVEPGLVADFGFNWRATSQTSMFASLSQTVEESTNGEIDTVVAGNLGFSTTLTQRSSFSTSARLSFENPVFDSESDGDLNISVGPTYSYQLTENWRLSATYSLRYETDDDEDDLSSRFSVRLGRAFNLF